MRLVALREIAPGELRVAITPESAKGLIQAGCEVHLEAGAGIAATFPDEEYAEQGVTIASDREALVNSADIWLVVGSPARDETRWLRPHGLLVGFLRPWDDPSFAAHLAQSEITSFAMELLPRITRAQAMDALSSQASIAGYRAVILAAAHQTKVYPMMTTPAGTIPPARVLVIGAGVAGLQAIATAHRLGARVEAYDTRPAVREQVESLGARFLELDLEVEDGETAGGYAKAQGEDFLKRQRQLFEERMPDFDTVITTALIPGRAAPKLLSRHAIERMPAGGVVVDLAAANGGNCELTRTDEDVHHNGVQILGPTNLAAQSARGASRMYSRNLLALVRHLLGGDATLNLDFEDEITASAVLTHRGDIMNQAVRERAQDTGA